MPCAFPSHQNVQPSPKKGKKSNKSGQQNKVRNICPKEDRSEILNRIQGVKLTKEENIEKYRKQKKAEKSKVKAKLKKQQVKGNQEEDTLNPYTIFDSYGMVNVAGFAGFVRSSDGLFGCGSETVQTSSTSTSTVVSTAVDNSEAAPEGKARDNVNEKAAGSAISKVEDGAGSFCMEKMEEKFDESTKSDVPTIISSDNSFTNEGHVAADAPRDEVVDRVGVEETQKTIDEVNISDVSPVFPSTNCSVNDTHVSADISGDEVNSSLDVGCNTTVKKRNKKSKTTCPSPSIQTVTRSGRIVKPKIK